MHNFFTQRSQLTNRNLSSWPATDEEETSRRLYISPLMTSVFMFYKQWQNSKPYSALGPSPWALHPGPSGLGPSPDDAVFLPAGWLET
jgi:hypothetical protein